MGYDRDPNDICRCARCGVELNHSAEACPNGCVGDAEFMIERLNIALDHIRSGVPHMASACLLADISRLKADLQECAAPPVQEGPKGVEAMFEAACSGLRYTKPDACGEVSAIHINGVRYPVAPAQSIPAAIDEEKQQ